MGQNHVCGPVYDAEALKDFLAGLLTSRSADGESTRLCADMYIRAELSGLGSHGVMRLIRILDGIRTGTHWSELLLQMRSRALPTPQSCAPKEISSWP